MRSALGKFKLAGWPRHTWRWLITVLAVFLILALAGRSLRRNVVVKSSAVPIDPAVAAEFDQLRQPVLDYDNAPDFWVDVDYTEGPAAAWWPKGESPILAKLVARGELPPVAERVGSEPVVYRGFAGVGQYGGDWWRLAKDVDDIRLTLQYELKNNQLVRYSPYGEPIRPHLARRVEANDDFTAWTVYLRRGVKWSDGTPFTADDIIWWWENVKKNEAVGAIDETMKVNGVPGEIEKVDEFTLRFVFPAPNPGWLAQQAGAAGALYMAGPRHYLQQFHPTLGNQELIAAICRAEMITPKSLFSSKNHPLNPERPCLGPWIFRTYSSNGPWTAVRNPYYFAVDEQGNQLPYIDRLVFRQVGGELQGKAVTDGLTTFSPATESSDYASLMSGQVGGNYTVQHWAPDANGSILVTPNRVKHMLAKDPVDKQKAELLANPEFRRALSIAVNRQAIIDAEMKGVGVPAQLGPAPGRPWFDPDHLRANAEHDPAQSRQILDSLGLTQRDSDGFRTLKDGNRLLLTLITRPGTSGPFQFLIQDWADVGLRVILQEKPHRLFMQVSRYADLQAGGSSGAGELSWYALGAGGPYWGWYYKGGMYDAEESRAPDIAQPTPLEIKAMRLGQTAGNTQDPTLRLECASEVMRIAREQVWSINIGTPTAAVAVVKNGLRGVPETLLSSFMLCTPNNACPEAWYWERPDSINGERIASPEYLRERENSIIGELQQAVTKPTRGGAAVAAVLGREATSRHPLGALMKWLMIGVAVIGGILLALRHPFILRRLMIMIPTLIIISIIVYTGVQLPEGSYLDTVVENLEQAGMREQAEQELAELTAMYHLDDSAFKNYFRWTGLLWFVSFEDTDKGLLQGNMGRSMSNDGAFVADLLGDRLLLTFCISLGTILLTWLVAIPIGVYSAVRQYSAADYVLTIGGFIGMCIPQFILALVLMLIGKELFGVTLMGLFSEQYAMQEYWDLAKFLDLLKHIWLPIVVVGATGTAGMIRIMRANLLDELKKPYVTTAKAKGVRPLKLLFKYPFRLALNPFISGIGGLFPALISGSAIVAIILSLPTVGPLLLDAVRIEDTYMAGSLLLLLSTLSVLGVLVSDLLLMIVDPRIRVESGRNK